LIIHCFNCEQYLYHTRFHPTYAPALVISSSTIPASLTGQAHGVSV
jgi:hypothetical protein